MKAMARYGEIFLKGKNRNYFEKKLVNNIRAFYKREDRKVKIERKRNRLLVEADDFGFLRQVFGLISYSLVEEVDLDLEKIKEKSLELARERSFKTFAVAAKRMEAKTINSKQINELVGEYILKNLKKKVDLRNPDLTLGIELIDNKGYIFTETTECFGGLPVGVEGEVFLLVKDRRSLLSGLLMMKRGCAVAPFGLEEKKIDLLQKYTPWFLKFKKIKSLEELEGEVVVSSEEIKGKVVLDPLVGLTEKEIKEKIELFENG